MSDKKKEKGAGQFVCGKCGNRFPKAHGLAIHILRTHKKNTWGKGGKASKNASSMPSRPLKERKSIPVWVCPKCGRDKFVNGMSYAAHQRYCKGTLPAVSKVAETTVLPQLPAPPTPGAMLKQISSVSGNGHNQVERLKAMAAQKRREAEQIERLVASFESDAQKFLT